MIRNSFSHILQFRSRWMWRIYLLPNRDQTSDTSYRMIARQLSFLGREILQLKLHNCFLITFFVLWPQTCKLQCLYWFFNEFVQIVGKKKNLILKIIQLLFIQYCQLKPLLPKSAEFGKIIPRVSATLSDLLPYKDYTPANVQSRPISDEQNVSLLIKSSLDSTAFSLNLPRIPLIII